MRVFREGREAGVRLSVGGGGDLDLRTVVLEPAAARRLADYLHEAADAEDGARLSGEPADPFRETGDSIADALAIGRPLFDGIREALVRRGLFGLYEAVLGMDRGDLEASVLTFAHDLLEDAERGPPPEARARRGRRPRLPAPRRGLRRPHPRAPRRPRRLGKAS